ncbi:hypothetical protein BD289DRAFT_361692 [Coniella lustricola]|uniref:Arrestin-like N-terminal domain-containing protein n=1 Tax=Coniella lustricola TaxID=2025994 RepID=A0A2T3AHU8_9PEZI|nr:hypothetical protein BD289DRAFT_361692 [Coniella lustricola]
MSIRIALNDAPEFYTNLDIVSGKVILGISRPESIGAVIVKLEGESKTALSTPDVVPGAYPQSTSQRRADKSQVVHENHKVLYKVQQVYPTDSGSSSSPSLQLGPGQYAWDFKFKMPVNNACSNPNAMAKLGSVTGAGGLAGPSFLGMGGIKLMDPSRQLFYKHVTRTLPPSFTGFPKQAEIRYYIKVTIQRPGIFKENYRHQLGFKFLPIEPPRPPATNQEAYARRPFTFRPKSPGLDGASTPSLKIKKSGMLGGRSSTRALSVNGGSSTPELPPSVELSARLPHPSILTCNKPIPLRIIAKKLVATRAECYLTSIQIELVGSTVVRAQGLTNTEQTRWVVVARHGLAVPLQRSPDDAVGKEIEVDSALWKTKALPNTVMPTFLTCNLKRTYAVELKLGVSWGKPPGTTTAIPDESAPASAAALAQTLFLPLHFTSVHIYSGLKPPEGLVQAAMQSQRQQRRTQSTRPAARPSAGATQSTPSAPPRQEVDPLYPPQLQPGQEAFAGLAPPSYDDAPPSYDEAVAESLGPVAANERPAYSGVTNENAPDTLAEKNT